MRVKARAILPSLDDHDDVLILERAERCVLDATALAARMAGEGTELLKHGSHRSGHDPQACNDEDHATVTNRDRLICEWCLRPRLVTDGPWSATRSVLNRMAN